MNEQHPYPGPYWQAPMGVQPNPMTPVAGQPVYGPGPAYGAAPYYAVPAPFAPVQPAPAPSLLGNPRFLKGALVGAAAAYLLTNETVQQNAIRAAVKAWSMLQGGVEEMKERFRDAEAELHAAEAEEED
jgi:hypothetical protein